MKKMLLTVSTFTILGLAFFLSGCTALHRETPKDEVELSNASVGDIVAFGDIRWYVIAKTDTGYTLLSEKPVIKQAFRRAGRGIFTVEWEDSGMQRDQGALESLQYIRDNLQFSPSDRSQIQSRS